MGPWALGGQIAGFYLVSLPLACCENSLDAKDKTIIQFESAESAIKTETLYKTVRNLEGTGVANIKLSHFNAKRPESRPPGQRDTLEITPKGETKYEFQIKQEERGAHTNKTIWGFNLQPSRFASGALRLVMRFRFEPVGANLKPTKPYVITTRAITLKKDKPYCILPAPTA